LLGFRSLLFQGWSRGLILQGSPYCYKVVIQLRDRLQGGFDIIRKFLSDGFKHFF
jgi:hypothetical protein